MSHPSRVRGLKPITVVPFTKPVGVAPFTGAWIETCDLLRNTTNRTVAPFTGAWIETYYSWIDDYIKKVAPFTGAWIETEPHPALNNLT